MQENAGKSGASSQETGVRRQGSEASSQKAGDRRQGSGDRGQETGVRRQETEDGGRRKNKKAERKSNIKNQIAKLQIKIQKEKLATNFPEGTGKQTSGNDAGAFTDT